jgi:hypothetical protein
VYLFVGSKVLQWEVLFIWSNLRERHLLSIGSGVRWDLREHKERL